MMALLDGGRPIRDILPPINHPDFEKPRPDKSDRPRFSIMPGLSISTAPLGSPTTVYSGPPPPYSSVSSTVEGAPGYFSPSHSTTRLQTKDDKDLLSTKTLPSLPSLHEALGNDKNLQFPGPLSASHSIAPGSAPATAVGQSFPDAPRGPSNPFHHTTAPPPLTSILPQSDTSMSKPAIPTNTGPEHQGYTSQPFSSSPHANANTHRPSAGSFPSITRPYEPPHNNLSYLAESNIQNSQYREYAPHPPASQPPPPFHFESNDKFDSSRNPFARNNSHPHVSYGDTVKRHLDVFDAELALNEITESSSRTSEFTRSWAQRYHQANRASCFAESAPSIQDIDEIVRHQHRTLENLNKIREVVVMEQTALSEQRARAARGLMEDEYHSIHDEYKSGGFAGGDAKKRRGKAAPPGRCHSCNRAETPEWRRGPDGARTLCNACGLHYAKLTRKLGANKAGALTGSSIRPKGLDQRPTHV